MQEIQVQSLGLEDPPEKEMATHSSTLAWKFPRAEEPGRLQSMGLQRVRHDLAATKWQQLPLCVPLSISPWKTVVSSLLGKVKKETSC